MSFAGREVRALRVDGLGEDVLYVRREWARHWRCRLGRGRMRRIL